MTHTPGPWKSDKMAMGEESWRSLWSNDIPIVRRGSDVIAAVWDADDDADKANARLIAAAPDLANALGIALTLITKHGLAEKLAAEHPEHYAMLQIARAAIAKATEVQG